ncbi:MAG: glycoside hydrolase family 2 protein [Oscillospiraceae bacterium]|nr:glycoside hydrolase family 2 protein [Oscillospiraceae bacterium]
MKIDLNGLWRLNSQQFTDLPAKMPGSVLSTLLEHKLIPDPFYGTNEALVRQYLKDDYTLTREFSMTAEQLQRNNYLFIDGVDTVAKLYINGHLIAELFDMHTRKRILLDNAILRTDNEIRLEFTSAYRYIENYPGKEKFATFAVTHPNGPVIRKSHHMLGWDWGPDLADMGIYRDMYILSTQVGYLDSFRHECTFYEDGSVMVEVEPEVVCHCYGTLLATLSLEQDGTKLQVKQSLAPKARLYFHLPQPKLWYPVGFGAPTLYDLTFTLVGEGGESQTYSYRIGIRQVQIDNTPDEYGTNFAVIINGEKVFLKGSNYIPEDNILSRVDRNHTLRLLKLAKDFNHNVIRVWGGGYYPDKWFYDYCDEHGILVWQDLMFACASYNINDEHFKTLIREEVVDAVKRFRYHASVFYIAGDNECEDGVNGHEPFLMEQYRVMSQEILVPLMKTLTNTFYAYTSPHSAQMFHMQNDHDHFDTHYWWIRDARLPLEDFAKIYPRMLSEVGFESFPMYETIQKVTPEDQMSVYSQVMMAHEKRPTGNQTVEHYTKWRYGEPESFRDFIYLQNLVQGEAIKICAEHLRTNKFRCNGIMYWQLNDCWPGLSCSSIDYDFGLKALHYFSRKFFAPHLVTVKEADGKLTVSIANDTPNDSKYQLQYRFMTFGGKLLDERRLTAEVSKTDDADVLQLPTPFTDSDTDKLVHVRLTDMAGNVLSENFYQHCSDKQITYPKANISVRIIDSHTAELTADTFAKHVFLQDGCVDTVYSDNYFNLLKGEPKIITSQKSMDWGSLKIQTLDQVIFKEKEEI